MQTVRQSFNLLTHTFIEENANKARLGKTTEMFNYHDEDLSLYTATLEDMEKRLFGLVRQNNLEQEITSKDFIAVKTGTGVKFMKNGPKHIMDAEDLEPLYTPQENILEECLRREAERVAHQENLMNRVVYDSVDPAPKKL